MLKGTNNNGSVLRLRVGEFVEVRSREEIFRTLDAKGTLESLPFMPEMLKLTGKRCRVFRRIDKICGSFENNQFGFRRMRNTVLLEGVHCDGEAHEGCQAACMILWKEAWLKRVLPSASEMSTVATRAELETNDGTIRMGPVSDERIEKALLRTTVWCDSASHGSTDKKFVCQMTEAGRASLPLSAWDLRPYMRDVWSRNVGFWEWVGGLLILAFNKFQQLRKGVTYPYLEQGKLTKTPGDKLDLQAGEIVEVKSKNEILQTLDRRNRNRGLLFDVEMLKYCGRRFTVRGHVQKMISSATGKMVNLSNDCVVLDTVICKGECHQFCPRSEYIFWREIWLRRVL
jgi:hypothetical protein